MSSERRKIFRRPVKYPARIDIGGGSNLLPCILVDASDEGVQVVTVEALEWPNEIDLVLGYQDNGRRRCRVAWQNGRQAGLEFVAKNTPLLLPAQTSEPAKASHTKQVPPPQPASRQFGPAQGTQRDPFDIDTLPPTG